ncbi:diguanylate cyclase [Parasphingorhabdus sp.]|uniref:diguanylate cyclase n=1 Tax=Parasphingorhabdus sp. TaxID=2709688 RepID=UPI003A93E039
MKLATITNWAYGTTVVLTVISGTTMLMASNALDQERAAEAQRYRLDKATHNLEHDAFALTGQARQYVITEDPTHLAVYQRTAAELKEVEDRLRDVDDAGAGPDELKSLEEALRWVDSLHVQQIAALAAQQSGDTDRARQIMFGAEYERELNRVEAMIDRFQYRLDERTGAEVKKAAAIARAWKTVSEIVLALTGLLFLFVLYFIFKRRVLRPVVRLSDVVKRLAEQDYTVEAPTNDQIDEIGDMADAIELYRENAIERQRLEVERDAERLTRDLLSRMTQRMQGCDSMADLKEVIQRFAPEIVPGLAGRLYLLDASRNAMVEACSWLSPGYSRSEFSALSCWGLRRGLPHRPGGKAVDVPCEHLQLGNDPLIDSICLPLTIQQETLGLLYFEPVNPEEEMAEVPEIRLRMLSENIGLALANMRLRDALREMAMADPLTGLANRRQLDAVLKHELAEAERLNEPISCLMIDVDHFKQFNDRFGHDAGDAVLREVGSTLRDLTRDDKAAFRYGGEEFVLLMPGVGSNAALARAEDIRERISDLRIQYGSDELGPITVSVGVASLPEHCGAEDLVKMADNALRQAKSSGRNRVETAVHRMNAA